MEGIERRRQGEGLQENRLPARGTDGERQTAGDRQSWGLVSFRSCFVGAEGRVCFFLVRGGGVFFLLDELVSGAAIEL